MNENDNKNVQAFLDTISHSEGTDKYPDKGYKTIVGGSQFKSYSDHPHKLIDLGRGLKSTAAGRYQLLSRYFDVYKVQLKLPDFSPESQDAIAIQQIKECHALKDIEKGDFHTAIKKCARIWASFPGAGYGQHENKMSDLQRVYLAAGGESKSIFA